VFIVHGDADPTVPYQASLSLKADLDKAGAISRFHPVPGGVHGKFAKDDQVSVEQDALEFLRSGRNERWRALNCRFWTISFNDVAVEIVFSEVRQLHQVREPYVPHHALLEFLRTEYRSTPAGH
jgi:acetyl esterase/lipase